MKEIDVESYNVPAEARSKNYRGSLATVVGGGGAAIIPSSVVSGGVADTAKVAQSLAADSPDWAKIMRKDQDERTDFSLSIGKDLIIGDIKVSYDSANGALALTRVSDSTLLASLYASGGLTAYGAGSGTSGGGTSYNRLDKWSEYTTDKATYILSALLGDDLNTRVSKLENSTLTSVDWSIIANKPSVFAPAPHTHNFGSLTGIPTTLAGYGITDANIANGVITLGAKSITPITSHQSLSAYSTTTQMTAAISGAVGALDVAAVGGVGSYIQAISETDGKISASVATLPTKLSQFANDIHAAVDGASYGTIKIYPSAQITSSTSDDGAITPLGVNRYVSANYLPLSGGRAMSGDIIPFFRNSSSGNSDYGFAKSGALVESEGPNRLVYNTFIGSYYDGSDWYNMINIRHRDGGYSDGNAYGMQIRRKFTSSHEDIQVASQFAGTWGSWFSLLDSLNYPSYITSSYISNLVEANLSDTATLPMSLRVRYNNSTTDHHLFSIIGGNQAEVINMYLGSTYGAQLAIGFGCSRLAWRNRGNSTTWGSWMNIIAGSADKLTTPRSIWGQSFDGSGNVDGTLTMHSTGNQYYKIIRHSDAASEYSGLLIHASDDSKRAWTLYNGNISDGAFEIGTSFSDIIISPASGYGNRNVGIGTTLPAYKLDVNGTLHASGAATLSAGLTVTGNILATEGVTAYTTSDRRLKKNIRPLDSLKVIRTLGGTFAFEYKKDNRPSIGFIAQNVRKSELSDMVRESDGYLRINYLDTRLISLALGASVELDDEVTRLKKRVGELEKEVELLKAA